MSVKHISMAMAMALCLASCDEKNDDFTPGAATPEGCMQVYFDSSNQADFIDEPGARTSINVVVSRVDSTAAAEVPIICKSADDGLSIPSSVKFEAGAAHADLTISFGDLEVSKKYNFTLAIDDDYADHYSKLDGTSVFTGYVLAASWDVYVKDATMTYTTGSKVNTWTVDIERLGDTDRYSIRKFMGSDLDMTFTVGASVGSGYYKINPYTNYYTYTDASSSAGGFYLYDTANDDMPHWTVGDKEIEEICFLNYYGSSEYTYIGFTKGYAVFSTWWSTYTDGSYDYYNYVELTFDPVVEE